MRNDNTIYQLSVACQYIFVMFGHSGGIRQWLPKQQVRFDMENMRLTRS
jgi:hypothetical protein